MQQLVFFSVALGVACSPRLPERGADASTRAPEWTVAPSADAQNAASVSRIRVLSPGLEPDALWLVQGELSDYYLRRIRERDLPQTLLDRVVPSVRFGDEAGLWLAPSVPLEVGESYSLVAPVPGLIGTLEVTHARPRLDRVFPPAEAAFAGFAVYCGTEPLAESASGFGWLEPGHVPSVSRLGVDGLRTDACVRLEATLTAVAQPGLVPPLGLGPVALDPAPLEVGEASPLVAVECGPGEVEWGPGCATVEDDRVVLRSPGSPTLWTLAGDLPADLRFAAAGESLLIGGLTPLSTYQAELGARSAGGELWSAVSEFETLAPRPRVVLNEVLANPLGLEPAQEWIELCNDGTINADLDGYVLQDAGGQIVLPGFVLAPGAFVLLAREDYSPGGLDVAPLPGTPILKLEALGKNGLSNAGEPLSLWRKDGTLASAFPATPKPKAGVSVARKTCGALDGSAESFAVHGPPGASPGGANGF